MPGLPLRVLAECCSLTMHSEILTLALLIPERYVLIPLLLQAIRDLELAMIS